MSTILATQVRKYAKGPAKPAGRYWKGKAPKGAELASESEEEEELRTTEEDVPVAGEHEPRKDEEEDGAHDNFPTKPSALKGAKINVALKNIQIPREVEEEEEEESLEEEDESESSEKSESEDEKPALRFRPVFVPKRGRATITERDAIAKEAEEMQRRREMAAEERKRESHDLVAESIKRELAEKEKEEDVPDVDDTDGIDPEGEFEAWRLRELGRIRKEKEEELRREEEREEIERRRALPEEQRLKEDLERAKKSREEKPKGKQKFLQKYWHKGAFHQDDEILQRHDYTEATESTVDVSVLPKVMQVKNFGKRSRTKYTHLLDQDTSAGTGGFGGVGSVRSGGQSIDGGGCFLCGGPHLKKDCPQNMAPDFSRRPATNGQPDTRHQRRIDEDRRSSRNDKPRRLDRDDRPYDASSRRRQSPSPYGARRTAKDQEDTRDDYSTKRRRLD